VSHDVLGVQRMNGLGYRTAAKVVAKGGDLEIVDHAGQADRA
jgi:hypothetical protein